jgi:hypothetical protein
MKRSVAILTLATMVLVQSAASAHPGRPDVWTGPLPVACTKVYLPVHDARGNTYGSQCEANALGVRVTWPGEAD